MQIGCCAPIEKYAQIVSDGYDYVEFPAWEVASLTEAQLQAVIQSIEEKGVPCLRLNAYCKGTPAIVGEGYSRESALRYAENLMEKAARLHVRCVGIGAPSARNIPEGFDRALADKQCEEFLRTTAEVAAGYGIQILVEAVQRGMCNYMNRTEEALRMAETLDMDNVGLVVDLYHMQTENEDWDTLGPMSPGCGICTSAPSAPDWPEAFTDRRMRRSAKEPSVLLRKAATAAPSASSLTHRR